MPKKSKKGASANEPRSEDDSDSEDAKGVQELPKVKPLPKILTEDKKEKKNIRFQLPEPPIKASTSSLSIILYEHKRPSIAPNENNNSQIYKRKQPRNTVGCSCLTTEYFDIYEQSPVDHSHLVNPSETKKLFDRYRDTPDMAQEDKDLIRGAYLQNLDMVKSAIERGANVNAYREKMTALLIATEYNHVPLVRYLLSVPRVNVNFRNTFGQAPLLIALKNRCDEIVQMLINHNANVNTCDGLGRTPLHCALTQRRPDMVKLLLTHGADCNKADFIGERPIYTSTVRSPNLACLKLLVSAGASTEYNNVSRLPLLSRLIINSADFDMIQILVENGAQVNSVDVNSGKTPLHFAAALDDVTLVQYLVEQGADPNMKTAYNFTPYDEAVSHRCIQVAEFLLRVTENTRKRTLSTFRA